VITFALCLALIAAGAVIAAQARRLHEADDYIAALNEALEEAHREVVTLRKLDDLDTTH
jgi:hypothetical protein